MPYKITRSESYKADQTKSGDSLKHYGRKGMKWGKEVFGKDDVPSQRRSSSNSGSAQPKKALSSALSSRVNENVGRGESKPRSGLQKWFDQAGKDIGNTFNSAKKGVEDAANDAKKWTDNAIKDIGKTAVKIGDDAKRAYGDAEKWVNGAIKDVGNAAVKVGDDAKKAYGDAKKWVDTTIGDAKKWTDQAGKDIGKTASDLADELVYGTKYAIGTAKYAAKNAASKVKDTYERITDTGTQRLLNPKHMTSRQKQAIWSKKSTKQGIEENLKKGLGPGVSSYDAFKAIDKQTGGKGYDVSARAAQVYRDLAKLRINSALPQSRALASKRTRKVKFPGPSMADAKKYLSPVELSAYTNGLDYMTKYGDGDGSIKKELNRYLDKVAFEKSFERNKK